MKAARFSTAVLRTLPAAVTAVAAALALRRLDDFDTWWHLASGRWIVEHGAVPHTDTLSHTVPGHPWINLQWLYDVSLFLLYRLGGADLLVVAATLSFAGAVWLMLRNASRWVGPGTAAFVGLWAVLVVEERFLIRPEMASFVLLEATLLVLMSARASGGRQLWLLVPLMALWANCHSLFIIGLFCIGCTVGGALLAELPILPAGWREASRWEPEIRKRLLLASAAAAAATLLNPYFFEGFLFPFKLLSRIDGSNTVFRAIGEFRRPFSGYFTTFALSAYQSYFFFALSAAVTAAGVGLFAAGRARPKRERLPGFDVGQAAILVGLAYLSLLARRNIGIFAFGVTPIVAAHIGVVASRSSVELRAFAGKLTTVLAPAFLATCLFLLAGVVSNTYYQWSDVTREFGLGVLETNFPVHAAEFAKQAELPPKLYNDLTAGGYLTWEAGVPGGVFIDGRLEVYDTDFFSSYLSALSNPRSWQSQVDEFGVNTVILFHRWGNRQALVRALTADRAWSLVYHDEVAAIFVRTAGNEAAIRRARAMYPDWHEALQSRLTAPVSSWQKPIERVLALDSYGLLLTAIGAQEEAARNYERLLELELPTGLEANVRLRLGYLEARAGNREVAKMQLRKAAELDPGDKRAAQLLERLGD